jgi:DNA primase
LNLIIRNHNITAQISTILEQVRRETGNRYFSDIQKEKKGNILVSCPFHKDGKEKHASCSIVSTRYDEDVYGTFHCWSCGAKGSLAEMIGYCFNAGVKFGEDWLFVNFGNELIEEVEYLQEIVLDTPTKTKSLDESFLNQFEYDNDDALKYLMNKRKLSYDVIRYFKIGYDKSDQSVTFPMWNISNKLVCVTKRSIVNKQFYIPPNIDKPVYLLNYIKKLGYNYMFVVESQINALTLWGWGYPAVALIGTGSKEQINIINKSGVGNIILCMDGDLAGRHGTIRLCNSISNDIMVSVKEMIQGKDVNDLTADEFKNLPIYDRNTWFRKENIT